MQMKFDPNQTEFTSDYERVIWDFGKQIVPPEISLADAPDEETREGCMQIYDCTMEILADINNHPEDYPWCIPYQYTGTYIGWLLTGAKTTPFKRDVDAYAHFCRRLRDTGSC